MENKFTFKPKNLAYILITTIILFTTSNTSVAVNALTNKIKSASIKTNVIQKKSITAEEAKNLLIIGNNRFVSDTPAKKDISEQKRKNLAVNGQKPFAVILSCSDSRVPPEIVFDQALGDLFVVRNAGNVVDPVILGSIEYGVEYLNAPLIVVMGHQDCGAVKAAVDGNKVPGSIGAIINKIKPICDKLKTNDVNKNDSFETCTDENIKNSAVEIAKSPVIKKLVAEKKVSIVTAKYHIETGRVVFQ